MRFHARQGHSTKIIFTPWERRKLKVALGEPMQPLIVPHKTWEQTMAGTQMGKEETRGWYVLTGQKVRSREMQVMTAVHGGDP